MDEDAPDLRPSEVVYPFEVGATVSFDLSSPCLELIRGNLICGQIQGYIEIRPFRTSYHFKQSCSDGHYVRMVPHAEAEIKLNLPRTSSDRKAVRDMLTPSRRTGMYVLMRDGLTCVYCGRVQGEVGFDGKPIFVDPDHIIPKSLIDLDAIRLDKDLVLFARDIQLVTACGSHNSAKQGVLLPLDVAVALFTKHVLKGDTAGAKGGLLNRFHSLYRLADRNARLRLDQA